MSKNSDTVIINEFFAQKKKFQLCLFRPTIISLVPSQFSKEFSLDERLKLVIRAVKGYFLYYVTDGDTLCAYVFLKRNYLQKYAFLSTGELLINPYFVLPEYRGRGLATKMMEAVISDLHSTGNCRIWGVVKADNAPSIAVLNKLKFQAMGFSEKKFWSHHLVKKQSGLHIYSLDLSKKEENSYDLQD